MLTYPIIVFAVVYLEIKRKVEPGEAFHLLNTRTPHLVCSLNHMVHVWARSSHWKSLSENILYLVVTLTMRYQICNRPHHIVPTSENNVWYNTMYCLLDICQLWHTEYICEILCRYIWYSFVVISLSHISLYESCGAYLSLIRTTVGTDHH